MKRNRLTVSKLEIDRDLYVNVKLRDSVVLN